MLTSRVKSLQLYVVKTNHLEYLYTSGTFFQVYVFFATLPIAFFARDQPVASGHDHAVHFGIADWITIKHCRIDSPLLQSPPFATHALTSRA